MGTIKCKLYVVHWYIHTVYCKYLYVYLDKLYMSTAKTPPPDPMKPRNALS